MPRFTLATTERLLGYAIILGIVAVILAVGAGALLTLRDQKVRAEAAKTQYSKNRTITLTIDFGDNSRKQLTDIPFTPGMTVLDTLTAAKTHPRPIPSEISGSGDTALVLSIDGVKNQGGGTTSKNWQFWVNTRFAHRSAGATILHPGDRVVWTFRPWEDDPKPPSP